MSMFSGNQWNNISRPDLLAAAEVIWDASITGFRAYKTTDYINVLSSGTAPVSIAGIVNVTGVVTTSGTNQITGYVNGMSFPKITGCSAYTSGLIVSTSPARLLSVFGHNSNGSAYRFIQTFNAVAIPTGGSGVSLAPVTSTICPASGNFALTFPEVGAPYSVGICVGASVSGAVISPSAGDCWLSATYVTL